MTLGICNGCKQPLLTNEAEWCPRCWHDYADYAIEVLERLHKWIKNIESFQDKDTMYEGHIMHTKYTLPTLKSIRDG